MPVEKQTEISPAEGKLGVLLVGLGAVSTTFIAGVEAIKKGFAEPIGSLTQMGTIRLGKEPTIVFPLVKDFVPLAATQGSGLWSMGHLSGFCLRRRVKCRCTRKRIVGPTQRAAAKDSAR